MSPMDWSAHADRLAAQVTHPRSRWRDAVATTPRHLLVPRWWAPGPHGRQVVDGAADPQTWAKAAYSDRTLVTQIGTLHADHATPDDHPSGYPTSSSTLPSLVLSMFGHARIHDGAHVLDVGTGSGYGAALLARRLGGDRVTSVDVDPYLTRAAADRLDEAGLHPVLVTVDGTGPIPGGPYDRIVATVSVRPIPAGWLEALTPGGRLVTTITNTSMIVVADKTPDGGAVGKVARDWAMFMATRTGPDYDKDLSAMLEQVRHRDGALVTTSPYPLVNVMEAWELRTMLELQAPDIEHHYDEEEDGGRRTAWLLHRDGSWARATEEENGRVTVHQGGPRLLWDVLDETRRYWLQHGSLPIYGSTVKITPDGAIHLRRGRWTATIG